MLTWRLFQQGEEVPAELKSGQSSGKDDEVASAVSVTRDGGVSLCFIDSQAGQEVRAQEISIRFPNGVDFEETGYPYENDNVLPEVEPVNDLRMLDITNDQYEGALRVSKELRADVLLRLDCGGLKLDVEYDINRGDSVNTGAMLRRVNELFYAVAE